MDGLQLMELDLEYAKMMAIMDIIEEYGEDYIDAEAIDEILNL
jgi:hypothetical protein